MNDLQKFLAWVLALAGLIAAGKTMVKASRDIGIPI
jgi:hypothetical protein